MSTNFRNYLKSKSNPTNPPPATNPCGVKRSESVNQSAKSCTNKLKMALAGKEAINRPRSMICSSRLTSTSRDPVAKVKSELLIHD